MAPVDTDLLERLSARLDAQEAEIEALRATIARLESAATSRALAMPESVVKERARPLPVPSVAPSRRTLLKGAGAALFSTALLATGEVVSIEPFRVAAAPNPLPAGGMQTAVTADVIYQFYVGTDFLPEDFTRGSFGYSNNLGATTPGGGSIYQAEGSPVTGFAVRVALPQGATIAEVVFYLYCSDNTTSFVDMARYSVTAIQGTLIGSATSQPFLGSEEIALTPLSNTTVDNTQYSYTIEWRPGSLGGQSLFGARVGYTLPGSAQVYGSAQAGVGVNGLAATGIGMYGQADPTGSVGIKGVSASGFPIIGTVQGSNSSTNVHAAMTGFGTAGPGVQGQSTGGYGLVGFTSDTHGHAGLIGFAQNPGGIGLIGNAPGGASPGLAGVFNGDVRINSGTLHAPVLQAVVQHAGDNTYRLLHTVASPEGWCEDFGEAILTDGTATVTLDPDFAALIETTGYHVFLTEYGDHHSLFVTTRSATGFIVQAKESVNPVGMKAPTKGVSGTFGYRVVAKRKDITGERLAKAAPATLLKAPITFTIPQTPEAKPPTPKSAPGTPTPP